MLDPQGIRERYQMSSCGAKQYYPRFGDFVLFFFGNDVGREFDIGDDIKSAGKWPFQLMSRIYELNRLLSS